MREHVVSRAERRVKLQGALLTVFTHYTSPAAVRSRIRAWYHLKARDYFARRLGELCKALPWQQEVPAFRLLNMKKQWGSCAVSNGIIINPALIKAPRDCIDYVIVHELCHLKEHNHSPAFFHLLTVAAPRWEETKAKLDAMVEVLLNE